MCCRTHRRPAKRTRPPSAAFRASRARTGDGGRRPEAPAALREIQVPFGGSLVQVLERQTLLRALMKSSVQLLRGSSESPRSSVLLESARAGFRHFLLSLSTQPWPFTRCGNMGHLGARCCRFKPSPGAYLDLRACSGSYSTLSCGVRSIPHARSIRTSTLSRL